MIQAKKYVCDTCSRTSPPFFRSQQAFLCELCFTKNPRGRRTVFSVFDPISEMLHGKGDIIQINQEYSKSHCHQCQRKLYGPRIKCDTCREVELCNLCFKAGQHPSQHRLISLAHKKKLGFSIQQFKTQQFIDNGQFGEVYRAVHQRTGLQFALKKIDLDNKKAKWLLSSFENEFRTYSEVKSCDIVKCYGFTYYGSSLFILLEWMSQGTLQNLIKAQLKGTRLESLRRKVQYCLAIARALSKLHQKRYVHKDVKPDNILIGQGKIAKLGDMGVSGPCQDQDRVAPRLWAAPQLLLGKAYSCEVDIFSLGLVMNYMFTGELHSMDKEGQVSITASQYFAEIILKCLSEQPAARPSALQLEDQLQRFLEQFWAQLQKMGVSEREYMQLPTKEKNCWFQRIYQEIY